jgi:hypothetical protein
MTESRFIPTREELTALGQIYSQVRSPSGVYAASQTIGEMLSNSTMIVKLVVSSAYLIQSDDIEPGIALQAFVVLHHAFTPWWDSHVSVSRALDAN